MCRALQVPSRVNYGCGLATAAQLTNVSSGLAALESTVAAVMNQSGAFQTALSQGSQQAAALQAKAAALEATVAALNSTVQQLTATLNETVAAAIAQQAAALLAADQAVGKQLASLVAAKQTFSQDIAALKVEAQQCQCSQELSALNATSLTLAVAGAANAAAIASVNASAAALASAEAQRAAAVSAPGASVATLNSTVAAIDLSLHVRKTDAIDAATLGGVAAALYLRKRVVLFAYQTLVSGGLGGRAGADATCQAATTRPAGLVQARAFLSVDASDAIKDFPTKYGVPVNLPVESGGGIVVAGNWTELLGGSIRVSLSSAGVTNTYWWSGSSQDGSTATNTNNCVGWTSSNAADTGSTGGASHTDSSWIQYPGKFVCSSNWALVCIAF
jgi:hypothetical protein